MKNLVGTQFKNRYIIQSLLSKQSGRRTFLAQDTETQNLVVIKLLLFGPDFTWQDLKLFEREATTLQSLAHPAIPQYLDHFEVEIPEGKGFALVQTYIEAKSLSAWVSAGRTFSENDLQAIAHSLLNILHYLHSRKPPVIHRDLKPSNILLSAERSAHSLGTLYLVDFGSVQTARTSGTTTVVGTYGYMPPEQFGGRASAASDLYSLGATLIYLASGQHPSDFEYGELDTAASTLELSSGFADWISQLTHMKVSNRIASAKIAQQKLSKCAIAPPSQSLTAAPKTNSLVPPINKPSASSSSLSTSKKRLPLHLRPILHDFVVTSTVEELDIQFRSDRIPDYQQKISGYRALDVWLALAPIWGSIMLAIYPPLCGVVVFFSLAAFFSRRKQQKPLSHLMKPNSAARLSLWFPHGGPLMLSLYQLPSEVENTSAEEAIRYSRSARKKDAIIAYQTVSAIETSAPRHTNECYLAFSLQEDGSYEKGYLQIRATASEAEWLCGHLSQWKDVPIEKIKQQYLSQ